MPAAIGSSQRKHSVFEDSYSADYHRLTTQARREAGAFLAAFPWDHFVTLTFASPVAQEAALRRLRRTVRRLEQRARHPVHWFFALERGGEGLLHLHVLLRGTAGLDQGALKGACEWGRKHVTRYDPRKGATYYVTKYIGSEIVEYDIDQRCSRGVAASEVGSRAVAPSEALPRP
jgi:hypothetical protein